MNRKKLFAFTDGASRGNPGESGIGYCITAADGTAIVSAYRYLGKATNNVAEYTALIDCLGAIAGIGKEKPEYADAQVIIHSDSELMVRQYNGDYKIRDKKLQLLAGQVHSIIASMKNSITMQHVPRAANAEADRLANAAIDTKSEKK